MEPVSKVIRGTVAPRKCECCGHHEIGITTVTGDYIPLYKMEGGFFGAYYG
jgi:hypothetical protein